MKEFPKDIKFKYEWRRYQQRVLDDLEEQLDDNHLHIIAPPGSGKTVLGLEVAIRLNKPTLIFAPTISIRNQWIQRFCELFLLVGDEPNWISRDIKNPNFLTVVTYQALHSACTKSNKNPISEELEKKNHDQRKTKIFNAEPIIIALKSINIGTIIVDEAHHLKNEWWKSLNAIKDAIKPTIVGLTATPPYDVSFSEWHRYLDLNGPIDSEISVPELVVENDLCPHQDYIYLSEPTHDETKSIQEQREKALRVFNELRKDEFLINIMSSHPVFSEPMKHLDWIYTNLECYSSILIFLHANGIKIPEKHLEIIGDKKITIPPLSFKWIEILLGFYLFGAHEHFQGFEEEKERLINKLKRNGLIDRKTISFRQNKKINKFLSSSLSKLKSIESIVDVEHNTLGKDLRMVILTDYIRKEFLVDGSINQLELNKIGVLPIFEQLRRTNDRHMKIGVLSGSLIIIPISALDSLHTAAKDLNIDPITHSKLPFDDQYLIINTNEKLKQNIVQLITQIFEQGEIEVLIGTKSLLGEGWDAPTINSLILASFVGSYVLSNQMRGRAIRSERNNTDKTGNIWHLACIDHTASDGGDDIQLLKRRFKSFVGISNETETTIENGINRIHLPEVFGSAELQSFNKEIIKKAGQRDQLKQKWKDALLNGSSLIEQIKVPFPEGKEYKKTMSLYYHKTIANMIAMLVSAIFGFLESIFNGLGRSIRYIKSREDLLQYLMYIGILGVIIFGRQTYKTIRLYFKYRDISKDIQQIGEALLESLIKTGTINTEYSKLEVIASLNDFGSIYCHLKGGTSYEKSTFIKSLHEIIAAVDNPRYLIIRKSLFLKIISQKDYHAVPEIIGRNKKTAEYFERQWKRLVGSCELIYSRTIEGRKILLQSRINSLSSEFEDKTERINKWR
ncbi:DEAD/DEAH box helicase family protein [Lentimicrobium sp. L6]|uniref:DEAD/DEAH box helicase family protein n=1 Tax=Lentimicrobium sp. L6 TaxID=2735916 RepID=UPI001555BCCB|nr:DEAD/DEAH box helicase family protein [Lentimicrobium sp. L6]NPD84122.1 DEAD/DEAH box helicase family protein [Lentimicrobium sp. L6]